MAKRFRFRLETVLKVRRQVADEKKRVVADRLREISALQGNLMMVNEQIAATYRKTRENAVHQHLDVQDLSKRRFWTSHLQRNVLETQFRIDKARQQLAKDRDVLAEASKELKVVEKLRENSFAKHSREIERQETIEADELAVSRYLHTSEQLVE